ncbi:MAG: hypothetical protein KGI25_05830 [Thaumarchaeota archaeon]|nr:hypothetical protein [Nitrososphaerota archaeon]
MEEKDLGYYLESLLKYDLEYVSVINPQGRILDHTSRHLDLSQGKLEMLCMGIRLQHSMQSDFDEDLGAVNYIVTERDNLKFISVPILSNVILAIAKKGKDHKPLIEKLLSKEFFSDLKTQLDQYNTVTIGIGA